MEDLYFQTDNEGIIRMVSPSIVRFTGRNAEDLIGTPIRNLYENPAGIEYMYSILSENGFIHDYDVMLKKMDGTSRSTSLSAFVIKDETGMPIGVSGLVRDITRRKQAEEALQQANQKLNLLTSITRHDINNQLTALNGYLPSSQTNSPTQLIVNISRR
jgi:PAS domain S-box-containing protein